MNVGIAHPSSMAASSTSPSMTHIAYVQRAFAMLEGAIQAALAHADEQGLHEEICRMIVERGGLKMAWIGRVEPRGGHLRPLAWCGDESGYIHQLNIQMHDPVRGEGPSARSIRGSRPVVTNDIEHDPQMAPWREAALARGYRSAGAFPIRRDGIAVGTLSVYAGEPGFFTPTAVRWLSAVADVLSFALIRGAR